MAIITDILNPNKKLGTVKGGKVFDKDKVLVGSVRTTGEVFNKSGGKVGHVQYDGYVFDYNNTSVGKVESDGRIFNHDHVPKAKVVDGDMNDGAAGLLLLINSPK